MILAFAVIFDPRCKLQFVEFCFSKLDGATYQEREKLVCDKLYSLFEEYLRLSPLTFANRTLLDVSFSLRDNEDGIVDLLDISKKTNNVSFFFNMVYFFCKYFVFNCTKMKINVGQVHFIKESTLSFE